MRRHFWMAVCTLCAACGGSSQAETAAVHDIESAGNVHVIEEDPPSDKDHEPVVVTTAQADSTEGTQAPSDAKCVPLPVYFEKSSSELDETARSALDRVSDCLESRDEVTIEVIGHHEPRGAETLPSELVAKRTAAVLKYLDQKGLERTTYDVRVGDGSPGQKETAP